MPSGVMTPYCGEVVVLAAVDKKRVRNGIGAGSDHLRGNHVRFGVSVAEIQKSARRCVSAAWLSSSPLRNAQVAEFRVASAHFRRARCADRHSRPDAAEMRGEPGAAAFDGSHHLDGPIADQAYVVLALDLKGEQQHLREHDAARSASGRCRDRCRP